jgi:succinoglycan biosynthesis protein ExoV
VPTFWRPRPHIGRLINGTKRMQAAATLAYLMTSGRPVLSRDGVLENRIERLLEVLDGFCRSRGFRLNAAPSTDSHGDAETRGTTGFL